MSQRGWERDRGDRLSPEIDTSRPSISRVYDYMIGGKDNFAADREMAEKAFRIAPDARGAGLANRRFLRRVVRHLAAEEGVRQFLDLGSGLPTQGNVHEIVQEVDPDARVVYVDNDRMVLAHARALLATNGTTTVVEADVREPREILGHPRVQEFIDFGEPIGLLLFSILHHLNDDEDPAGVVAVLREALPPGSFVAQSNFFNPGDEHPEAARQALAAEKLFNEHLGTGRWRTRDELLAFFGDFELLEPGLVPLAEWRPGPDETFEVSPTYYTYVGGVARKR
ncbi:SAM-dependent methyltransferase [Sphaerisporangium fuscum]|uniref:SAM-dependent methyltransferase n=1 Tax=Sphaerisporangium fuscum TaxID=2835868 RepID=UPI001BDBB3DC|nr:SAM-dependent methyltransferase [Sphaerisporangium fuscum]